MPTHLPNGSRHSLAHEIGPDFLLQSRPTTSPTDVPHTTASAIKPISDGPTTRRKQEQITATEEKRVSGAGSNTTVNRELGGWPKRLFRLSKAEPLKSGV